MNISELLARNARKYPDHPAIITESISFTYQSLNEKVNCLANTLLQMGFQKGEKAILFMPNTPEFVISYFAVLRLEGIIVPVNAKFTQLELQYVIDHSDATDVKAFVVLNKPLEDLKNECERFLEGKIASFKIPKLYEAIEQLPRNATGKILKHSLREVEKV